MKQLTIITILLANLIFAMFSASAQEHTQHDDAQAHEHDTHYHKNHVALLVGATSNLSHSSTLFTAGVDYEFRFHEKIGIGFGAELLTGDATEYVLGIPVFIHPVSSLKFNFGPLLVLLEEHSDDHSTEPETEMVSEFGLRIGVAYDFHIGKRFSLTPMVNYDYVNKSSAVMYALGFGIGF